MAPETAIFDALYEEAFAMMLEARDYITQHQKADLVGMGARECTMLASETLRMTERLTQVIAWLLAQKAVLSGELTRAEANQDPYRLGTPPPALQGKDLDAMPPRLRALSSHCQALYARVVRLDSAAMS